MKQYAILIVSILSPEIVFAADFNPIKISLSKYYGYYKPQLRGLFEAIHENLNIFDSGADDINKRFSDNPTSTLSFLF